MWLSRQMSVHPSVEHSTISGKMSICDAQLAAVSGVEHRNLHMISPAGFAWMPEPGQKVLLLPDGAILGVEQLPPQELQSGDVCLFAGDGRIILRKNGEIHLNGRIFCNGVEVRHE